MRTAMEGAGAATGGVPARAVVGRADNRPRGRLLHGSAAIGALLLCGAVAAQPARLVGKIEERQLDLRPDSGGQLIGLIQGAAGPQHLSQLSGLLPRRDKPMSVCLKARNRDGTYFADGELSAPVGDERQLRVDAPGFPTVAAAKALSQPRPDDLAVMFLAPPCDARRALAYPAALGPAGGTLTAALNLGALREGELPQAGLVPQGGSRVDIAGRCRPLQGRSLSFNVLCEFGLPPGHAGGVHTLSVDYTPARGPGDTGTFEIWVAPTAP